MSDTSQTFQCTMDPDDELSVSGMATVVMFTAYSADTNHYCDIAITHDQARRLARHLLQITEPDQESTHG